MQDKKDGWRLRLSCLSIGWDLHTPDDPAAAPSHWQRYGFDGAGRLNAVSSPAGEYSYTYVEQSHLLASVTGPVHTVTNSYESGRDAMTSKTNAAASGTVSRFGARYDALGRRIETSRSGYAFAQNFVSDYQYDLLGQLTKDERFAGEVPGDPAAKLEGESFSFLYDGIGNRLTAQKGTDTTAYTPNALNQYTDIDGIEPVYDADGNLFSDGKNRYHWDAENRLTLVEPLVATEGSKRLEFKYDYIGRRVSKQVWTHTGGSWTDESTTAFVYDGWNLIEEVSTSSQTASINHYTWGLDLSLSLQGAGGVGGLLSVVCAPFTESGLIGDWLLPIGYVPGAPSTFHYTFDLNGNVSELLDSTGSIAAHYEYGPFGELLRETYPSSALSEVERSLLTFNFSTKYYDAELKTLYYGYRYYDPSHGRWLNRDPIEEQGGLNLYGFVGNDAVNWWDVLGMTWKYYLLLFDMTPMDPNDTSDDARLQRLADERLVKELQVQAKTESDIYSSDCVGIEAFGYETEDGLREILMRYDQVILGVTLVLHGFFTDPKDVNTFTGTYRFMGKSIRGGDIRPLYMSKTNGGVIEEIQGCNNNGFVNSYGVFMGRDGTRGQDSTGYIIDQLIGKIRNGS